MTTTAIGGQGGAVRAGTADNVYLPTRPIVRIHLLGSMRATSYLGDDVLPRSKKARAALAYLCLASGARVPRARLATMLWDRVRPEQARLNLRQAVFDLTAAMGPLAGELISARRATVRLNIEVCWIDALALVKSPYSDDATRADLAVLCVGELLEGLDDVNASFAEWLAQERVRFKDRLAGSLNVVLQRLNRPDSDAEEVATIARRLISFDPAHPRASDALMRALVRLGEPEEALREFERCRKVLWEASRVKPSLESERLYERLRTDGRPTSAVRAPVASSVPSRRTTHAALRGRGGRLRVGVLPFDATDDNNEQTLALSLSHEVAAGLARFRWFDVITPASLGPNLATDGQHEDANLDYVVDGTISGRGKVLQITVRLLDLAARLNLSGGSISTLP